MDGEPFRLLHLNKNKSVQFHTRLIEKFFNVSNSIGIDFVMWPQGLELVLVDFETTGFDVRRDRIVEFAYLVIGEDGEILERDSELICPQIKMPYLTSRKNNIWQYMLEDKPKFIEVAEKLCQALRGRIMVAHNADFDLGFLVNECERAKIPLPEFQAICSIKLVKKYWKRKKYNLEDPAKHVNHEGDTAHRAMADVMALHRVLEVYFEENAERFPTTERVEDVAKVTIPKPLRKTKPTKKKGKKKPPKGQRNLNRKGIFLCQAQTKVGQRCRIRVGKEGDYCKSHSSQKENQG